MGYRTDKRPVTHLWGLLLCAVFATLALDARICGCQPATRSEKARQPIDAELKLTGEPTLGGACVLSFTVRPLTRSDSAQVSFDIPKGITVIGGDTAWEGEIENGTARSFTVTTRFDAIGIHRISAGVELVVANGRFAAEKVLYVDIRGAGQPSTVMKQLPMQTPGRELCASAGPLVAAAGRGYSPAGFAVQGRFLYSDKAYDEDGFTGARPALPVRGATVIVWDKSAPPHADVLLGTTATGDNGYFSVQVADNTDRYHTGGRDVYVELRADSPCGTVEDYDKAVYSLYSPTSANWPGGTLDIGTSTPSSDTLNGALNILDVLTTGNRYAAGLAASGALAPVTAQWQPSGTEGTYYDSADGIIHLVGGADDPDEFDDDVILHEYGHYAAETYGFFVHGVGVLHLWTDRVSPQVAWNEGWAHYFASATRDWRYQVDNLAYYSSCTDLELPTGNVQGRDNEGAVAAALWDICDGRDDGADAISLGGEEIWHVAEGHVKGSGNTSIDDFWNGWLAHPYGYIAEILAIFSEHGITCGPTVPANPASCVETHGAVSNVWQASVADPAFTWSGAWDAAGVSGYYWCFGDDAKAEPSNWTTAAGCDPLAVPSTGTYYLRVKTRNPLGVTSAAETIFRFRYGSDNDGPQLAGAAVAPSLVRKGVDMSLAITATADDTATGGSDIIRAEYFISADPGAGNGAPMAAADGAFDSPLESLTATVDTSAWTLGTRTVRMRARDAAGKWSSTASVTVQTVNGAPPAAVSDLSLIAVPGLEKIFGEPWRTTGSATAADETKVIDLGSPAMVAAVSLTTDAKAGLFPRSFAIAGSLDGTDWRSLAVQSDYRASSGANLWQVEPAQYRYIRLAATPLPDARDKKYYVRLADVGVFRYNGTSMLRATWHATAADGSDASSGAASAYDLRLSPSPITAGTFASCASVAGPAAPGAPGQAEEATFSSGAITGEVYAAIKVGDEVPNWSEMSNVASASVGPAGFDPLLPEDGTAVTQLAPVQFSFMASADLTRALVVLCDRPDFPTAPAVNADGTKSKALRISIKTDARTWSPTASQWLTVKRMLCSRTSLYWRLEGANRAYAHISGPTRVILFDTGEIRDLRVAPAHQSGTDDAVWPARDGRPTFSWTDNTNAMRYFYVDVSTEPAVPLKDARKTVVLGGGAIQGASYRASAAEWLKVRKLASGSGGVLQWRVRAQDSQKALTIASAPKELVIDGGTWATSDVDLSSPSPQVSWTHDGAGIVNYFVQFSASADFPAGAKATTRVPAAAVTSVSYSLTEGDIKRLKTLAARNAVTTLHYRVVGQDADKAFATYSAEKQTGVPVP